LEANGILTSGTLGATLQANLTKAQLSVSTRQSLQQLMTGYTSRAYPDSGDIISFALNFATVKPDAPTIIDYDTAGYETVPGMPAGFQSIVSNRNLYAGIGTQPGLAGQYAQLVAAENAATTLAQIYETYGYSGDSVLPARSAQIGTDISTLETLFYTIDENPTGTFSVPSLPSLVWGQPALNATVGTAGPFGGLAGAPFADVNLTSVLNMVTLQQFVASGESWIVSIDSTYSSADEGPFTLTHGGAGGPSSPPLHLAAGEFVISVSGTYGFVDADDIFVISLKIGTSANQSFTWPPTPVISNESLAWNASGSTVFLGFGGAAGTALNQLSLVTVTFAPASWSAPSAL
jgi:hypothetical protein